MTKWTVIGTGEVIYTTEPSKAKYAVLFRCYCGPWTVFKTCRNAQEAEQIAADCWTEFKRHFGLKVFGPRWEAVTKTN